MHTENQPQSTTQLKKTHSPNVQTLQTLGHYFASLIELWLAHLPGVREIVRGKQVRVTSADSKRTLTEGQLKYLVIFDLERQALDLLRNKRRSGSACSDKAFASGRDRGGSILSVIDRDEAPGSEGDGAPTPRGGHASPRMRISCFLGAARPPDSRPPRRGSSSRGCATHATWAASSV